MRFILQASGWTGSSKKVLQKFICNFWKVACPWGKNQDVAKVSYHISESAWETNQSWIWPLMNQRWGLKRNIVLWRLGIPKMCSCFVHQRFVCSLNSILTTYEERAGDHIHTNKITCNIEEPWQKYQLGTAKHRKPEVRKGVCLNRKISKHLWSCRGGQ